jgi:hypothetical protein
MHWQDFFEYTCYAGLAEANPNVDDPSTSHDEIMHSDKTSRNVEQAGGTGKLHASCIFVHVYTCRPA